MLTEEFRKSSKSTGNGDDCVEVAYIEGQVYVRDSEGGDGSPTLKFTPSQWTAFQSGMADGEFDIPA